VKPNQTSVEPTLTIIGPTLTVLFQSAGKERIVEQLSRLCGELPAAAFVDLVTRYAKVLKTSNVVLFHAWPNATPEAARGDNWIEQVLEALLRAGLSVLPQVKVVIRYRSEPTCSVRQIPGPQEAG
jgi:hypothetical protein